MTFRDDPLGDLFRAPSERATPLRDERPEAVWLEMASDTPGGTPEMGIAWKRAAFESRKERVQYLEATQPNMDGVLAAFLQLAEAADEDFVSFANRYGIPDARFKAHVMTEAEQCDGWYPLSRMRDTARQTRALLELTTDLQRRSVGAARDWATILGVAEVTIHEWQRAGGDWWAHYWQIWHHWTDPDPPPSREEWLCIALIHLLSQLGYPQPFPAWRAGQQRPHLQLERPPDSRGALSEVAVQLLREFLGERAETGGKLQTCAAPDCVRQFVPRRQGHVYCGTTCKTRVAQRRRRAGRSQPRRNEKRPSPLGP
jgi:hypothetical protein